ncbi:MAG: glycosyltransferase [Tenuifilaceae bacterium]|nr:glycosyltransferase [Tenuifilaceae bacterium]
MESENIQERRKPVVSIIIVTYNSSKYVLESLESARNQTYQNIELIISDDCSTDNTVEICSKWIEKNKERFVKTKLVTVNKNTGTSINCNRGISASQGEWVKLIAGDDALKSTCIADNIAVILASENITVLQTNLDFYTDDFKDSNFIKTSSVESNPFFTKTNNAQEQYRLILHRNKILAPSIFIKREVINKVGGFDESIPLIEDLPFWTKVTKNGFKISSNNSVTVNHRIHSMSVTNRGSLMSKPYAKDLLAYSKKYKKGNVSYIHYCAYNAGLYLILFQNNFNFLFRNKILIRLFRVFTSRVMRLGSPKL